MRSLETPLIRNGATLALASALVAGCALPHPSRSLAPAPTPLGAVAVTYPSRSGSVIHAWFVAGRRGMGAVLLLHGMGADRTAMLGRASFLHSAGYAVLLPDLQGNGESPGDHVTYGALESLDADASLAFLRDHSRGERTGVIGVSMGGAAALLGPGPLRADALVLESVYPTIDDAVEDRLRVWLGPLSPLRGLVARALIGTVAPSIGVTEEELQPIDRVARIAEPVFVLAGTDDRYTTMGESRKLFGRAPAPKEFWAVDGAGHEDLHAFTPVEYERRVGTFLARYLRPENVAPAATELSSPAKR